MIDKFSKNLDMQDIGLFWQLTVKTIEDLSIGNENLTLEMYLIQMTHLKNIGSKHEISNLESTNNQLSNESLIRKKLDDKSSEANIPNQLKST